MGFLFKTIKGIFNDKANVESIVIAMEKHFSLFFSRFDDDPHLCLALTLLSRKWPGKSLDKFQNELGEEALVATLMFACIPQPLSTKALGYYIAYKENPIGVNKHPQFLNEFEHLLAPVDNAIKKGHLATQYNDLNPKRHGEFDDVLSDINSLEEMMV